MPIKTQHAEQPITEVVLTCETFDADTLTFTPAARRGDTHVFRAEHTGDTKRLITLDIDQVSLRKLITSLTVIADAYDRLKA